MQIIQHLDSHQSIRLLSADELTLGQKILKNNLFFKPGEKVLIVTDAYLKNREAAIWFEAAKSLGSLAEMIVLEGMTQSGEEPPEEVVTACSVADITFLHTSFSLTHTEAGKTIMKNKKRGFSLPTVDYELMMRTLTIDYTPVMELGQKLKAILELGSILRVTSQLGTDITVKIRSGQVFDDNGFLTAGEIGNLPAGEVFFAPLEGSINGTFVVNGSIADDSLDQPITIKIENGYATEFTGGRAAQNLKNKLELTGPEALHVAEIGIGTNPTTNPHGDIIEAEKAFGTVHLALGNNSSMGGKINVPIHLDGLTLEPEVYVDEKCILKEGNFLL
jgi:aminopeptidase